MKEPLDEVTIARAEALLARGIPLVQVAKTLGVGRASLYRYGLRSARGYSRG